MKIFIGTNNIANILTGLKSGLEDLGHTVTAVLKDKSKYYTDEGYQTIYRKWDHRNPKIELLNRVKEKIDYSTQAKKSNKLLIDSLKDTDLYIFLWSSFLSDYSDYEILYKHNKKVITLFAGSEVRYSKAFAQEYNLNIDKWEEGLRDDDINEKLNYTRIAELYSNYIVSVPDQSGLMLRDYDHFYLPIDLKKYQFNPNSNQIPKLIHAPTRTGIKGTEVFLEVIEKLKSEGLKFEFSFLQNLSHVDLMKKIQQSDVLLDELYFHGPGMMATEAMALGCAVATRKLNDDKKRFDAPVASINFENVYSVIKELIQNESLRLKYKSDGRKFVENVNDAKIVASRLINRIDSIERDYSADFLRKSFFLPSNVAINSANKLKTKWIIEKFLKDPDSLIKNFLKKGLV